MRSATTFADETTPGAPMFTLPSEEECRAAFRNRRSASAGGAKLLSDVETLAAGPILPPDAD
ncbi:MAG: hypothetical protein AAFR11_07230 [Pseudomonadota bacterium]